MSWSAFIERIDVTRMPCRVDLRVMKTDRYESKQSLRVVLHVADIVDGKPTTVNHETALPAFERVRSDADRAAFIRGCIRYAFEHEVDECFWFDKQQLYRPHEATP